ncbi:DNA polymerase alpha-associated DNA helicase A [Diplonema papillatum]|nr:DNA polymerase alpha-associated DNA helicase A [Diplonema papillatum]
MEEAVAAYIEATIAALRTEASEEESRVESAAKHGWAVRPVSAESGPGGSTVIDFAMKSNVERVGRELSRGSPVALILDTDNISLKGVLCAVSTSAAAVTLSISVDSDDWDYNYMEYGVTVLSVPTDVTYRAIKSALLGGGMGFGNYSTEFPPLSKWQKWPSTQRQLISLIFGSDDGASPSAAVPEAQAQRHECEREGTRRPLTLGSTAACLAAADQQQREPTPGPPVETPEGAQDNSESGGTRRPLAAANQQHRELEPDGAGCPHGPPVQTPEDEQDNPESTPGSTAACPAAASQQQREPEPDGAGCPHAATPSPPVQTPKGAQGNPESTLGSAAACPAAASQQQREPEPDGVGCPHAATASPPVQPHDTVQDSANGGATEQRQQQLREDEDEEEEEEEGSDAFPPGGEHPPPRGLPCARPIAFFAGLNASQREAVETCLAPGRHNLRLILGPPGTGKTETLCEVIRQVVHGGGRVLVATASNVAADNIVERLCVRGPAPVKNLRCVRLGHSARLPEALRAFSMDSRMACSDAAVSARSTRLAAQKIEKKLARLQAKRGKPAYEERRALRAELRQGLKDLRREEVAQGREIVRSATVVAGTVVNATQKQMRPKPAKGGRGRACTFFDLVVIDEACQVTHPAAWIPLTKGNHWVLAGDPYQLPPTVLSNDRVVTSRLAVSVFETVFAKCDAQYMCSGTRTCAMLEVQYRMHGLICGWSSREFYGNRLVPDATVAAHLCTDLPAVARTELTSAPLVLIDTLDAGFVETEDAGGSKRNEGEAQVVAHYVGKLLASGVPPSSVAVITPYAAQVSVLKGLLPEDVEVGTVDGFQGREKDVVVLSLVRSNAEGAVGFLRDERRLNVAITRARRHLAVVANTQTLRCLPFLSRLLEHFTEHGLVIQPEEVDIF